MICELQINHYCYIVEEQLKYSVEETIILCFFIKLINTHLITFPFDVVNYSDTDLLSRGQG